MLLLIMVCFPYEFTLLSNPAVSNPGRGRSLFPLRIYTALKLILPSLYYRTVCFPYEFTLLSNTVTLYQQHGNVCFPYEFTLLSNCAFVLAVPAAVCFPYEFTLLSNPICADSRHGKFVSPTNLHCSQTLVLTAPLVLSFVSPTNLHCSQTQHPNFIFLYLFVSPTNLHCSQTYAVLCANL